MVFTKSDEESLSPEYANMKPMWFFGYRNKLKGAKLCKNDKIEIHHHTLIKVPFLYIQYKIIYMIANAANDWTTG